MRDVDDDAAGIVQAAEDEVGVIDAAVTSEGHCGVACGVHVVQGPSGASLVGQVGQLNVAPSTPAVKRAVGPAGTVVSRFSGVEQPIVIRAGDEIGRVPWVDGDRCFILRGLAARLAAGADDGIAADLVDILSGRLIDVDLSNG